MHPFLVRPEHLEILERIRASLVRLRDLSRDIGGDETADRSLGDLLHHLDELFLVVVVGEVKSGKSTLINALLGSAVCAVGPTPVTDRITILRHGEEDLDQSDDGAVRARSVSASVLRGLAIVDTPGTNSLVRWHQDLTESFLPRADLVLFVTSCDRPYSMSESQFLHLIRDRWRRKIVFVLTKTDIKEDGEVEEILDYVKRCALQELGLVPEIIPLSPREAWHAHETDDEERMTRSGFPALRRLILETLNEEEKAHLRLRGPVDAGQALAESLRDRVRLARETLEEDFRNLRELRDQTEQRLRDLRRSLRTSLDRLSDVFASLRLRGEAFFASWIRVRRIGRMLSRRQAEEQFREEVVGDLDARIAATMESAVAALVDESHRWFADTHEFFVKAVENGPHRNRVVGQPATRFEADRAKVLADVRARSEEHLRAFDAPARARQLLAAASQGAGISVAGMGAGVLSAALLGILVGLWWSILAIPVAGVGLLLLGRRRSRLSHEWGQQVSVLEGRCRDTLGGELERALTHAREQVERIYRPYLDFYEAETEKLATRTAQVEAAVADLDEAGVAVDAGLASG